MRNSIIISGIFLLVLSLAAARHVFIPLLPVGYEWAGYLITVPVLIIGVTIIIISKKGE